MKDTLRKLSLLNAPPGHEDFASNLVSGIFSEFCDSVNIDNFNNIRGTKISASNNPKKIALYAHMDEISLMVTDIDKNGFISFISVGGVDPRILFSQEVLIHGKKEVYGVIGIKPPHLQTDNESKEIKIEELYIDIGMNKQQANDIIRVGDYINFKGKWIELQNNIVSSKALDNRAGIAVLIEVMKELAKDSLASQIIFNATTQEEVGLRGAVVSAFSIKPDLAIIIDAGFGDMPGLDKDETFILGKGSAIGIGPNMHPVLSKELINYAKQNNIPYQIDVEPGNTGTEAWAIQISRTGIPVLLISIPLRYMHTTVEAISMDDVQAAVKLIAGFIRHIDCRVEELLCL
ncbi:MAG: M42 family metallopeptidase [Deltaproteobacteria bacterium]